MRAAECSGRHRLLDSVHFSHRLQAGWLGEGGLVPGARGQLPFAICTDCGYFSSSRVVGLARVCTRHASAGRRRGIERTARGLHPVKAGRAVVGPACLRVLRCRRAGALLPPSRRLSRAWPRPLARRPEFLLSVMVPLGLRAKGTFSVAGLRPSLLLGKACWSRRALAWHIRFRVAVTVGRLQARPPGAVRPVRARRPGPLRSMGLRPFTAARRLGSGIRSPVLAPMTPAWSRTIYMFLMSFRVAQVDPARGAIFVVCRFSGGVARRSHTWRVAW